MISTRSITSATACLRQAYELAIRIDACDSFAPDDQCERERRQFQFQIEQLVSRLGFDLVERKPIRLISTTETLPGEITCPR